MKYVLDTNAVSALMRGDQTFIARLASTSKEDVSVPQPVLAEIVYGIERLPRSKKRTQLRKRYELIRDELARSSWTDGVSEQFGAIKAALERAGTRIEDFDAAIAAHALARGAALVTADRSHMPRIAGLIVEDWSTDA